MVISSDALQRLADEARGIYETRIRASVEPAHDGKFIVIDLDSGEYEIDESDVEALRRAGERFPKGRLFTLRVGRKTAYRIGGGFRIRA